jgi:hypothetical protein
MAARAGRSGSKSGSRRSHKRTRRASSTSANDGDWVWESCLSHREVPGMGPAEQTNRPRQKREEADGILDRGLEHGLLAA